MEEVNTVEDQIVGPGTDQAGSLPSNWGGLTGMQLAAVAITTSKFLVNKEVSISCA